MTTLNNELVNELALQTINATDQDSKEMYYTMLFEELGTWVSIVAEQHYQKLKGYGATKEDIVGHYHDSIQKVIEGKAFATFDPAKGHFSGLVHRQARNPLKDYTDYLNAGTRAVKNEAVSLDAKAPTDDDATIADVIPSKEVGVAEGLVDSLHVTNLLDEFSKTVRNNGEAKAKAIYFLMYPEKYDTQHIADVLGHDQYDAHARKKVERIRKEFQTFMSQK